jgi:hypothetical protein
MANPAREAMIQRRMLPSLARLSRRDSGAVAAGPHDL